MTRNKYDGTEILSVRQATLFANLFDRLGEYHNANLMDDYIRKMGEAEGDLIKQAGLFRNLLKKLVGFGKRVFFKVYRELYSKAKEAQERLDDRIDEINKQYDKVKKDLKYHDLEGWRGGIFALNLGDSKEIMGDFDVAYGKLVQYLGLTGESEKAKEEGKLPEKDDSQLGKLPDISSPKEEGNEDSSGPRRERMTPGAEEGWTELARSVAFNPSQGSLRFDKKYFNYLLGKHLSTDGAGSVRYWSAYDHRNPPMKGKLKELMGEDVWEMKDGDNYIYLMPKTRGTDKGAPPVETPERSPGSTEEPEESFESPELPRSEEQAPEETPEIPEPEEIIEETPKPEEIIEETPKPEEVAEETPKPEEVAEETSEETPEEAEKSPASELAQRQSPKQQVWVELGRRAMKADKDGNLWTRFSKMYPAAAKRNINTRDASLVQDPELISFLDGAIPRGFPKTTNNRFPGHNANVTKIWLPTDLDLRKKTIDHWTKTWSATDKTSSRAESLKEIFKTTVREKWQK